MQFSFMLPDSRAGPLPPAPEMSLSSADLSEASLFFLLTYQPGDNLLEKKKKSLLHLTGLCQESLTIFLRHCVSSSELLRREPGWIAGGRRHRRGCHVL